MRSTQDFSVALHNEKTDAGRVELVARDRAAESKVICDGRRAPLAREQAFDNWLRGDVAAAYDALKSDPSTAISFHQIKARLAARHRKAVAPPT
jgi:Arc/MetJ-type ribon-helix-helix transcriptional regulator